MLDSVVMLTVSDWPTEPRRNHYHHATRLRATFLRCSSNQLATRLVTSFLQPDIKALICCTHRQTSTKNNTNQFPLRCASAVFEFPCFGLMAGITSGLPRPRVRRREETNWNCCDHLESATYGR